MMDTGGVGFDPFRCITQRQERRASNKATLNIALFENMKIGGPTSENVHEDVDEKHIRIFRKP